MLNSEFYPTPKKLIDKMLEGTDLSMVFSVLEPSAGKGDIVEVLDKLQGSYGRNYERLKFDIDCIELDRDLRSVLEGKEFRVVASDFLKYSTIKEYDLIIMNPPFSTGSSHLQKALDLQERNGGAVICLLNAETLKNPYTNERKALKQRLEDYDASIEFVEDAFIDAERKTNVEVALVKVLLPKPKRQSIILERLKKAQEQEEAEQQESTDVVENDFLKAIVSQFQAEVKAGVELIREYYAMQSFILDRFEKDEKTGETVQKGDCILELRVGRHDASVNEFLQRVREKYWRALFSNHKFTGQLTSNLQGEFYNKLDKLKDYDFSIHNINEVRIQMLKQVSKGIEDSIISLFEEFSYKHSWYDETSSNIHYYNGWKTNKAWIINKKVIIPLQGWRDLEYSWGGFKPTNSEVGWKLADIEKCFDYLAGVPATNNNIYFWLQNAEQDGQSRNIELKYFKVTFYKKGTCHITFSNEELLKKFNIYGSQKKGWLPPGYGKKKYEEMGDEEKSVIDDFEGETEYAKVVANPDYYLFSTSNLSLLENGEE